MKIGLIGLGSMGLALVQNLIDSGHEVIAWNRSEDKREIAKTETSAIVVDSIKKMVDEFRDEKKIIISIVAAGKATDGVLFENNENLFDLLSDGDIVIEMANSHYKDSMTRADKFSEKKIGYLDVGISGGVEGARNGACCMVGGDKDVFADVEQVFVDITVENGYGLMGKSGAGHFVKMVHNGIEYGMMAAIGEGINLISQKKEFDVDFSELLGVWNNGSIIESNLIGYLKEAFDGNNNDNLLSNEDAEIGDLGTGKWTTQEALDLGLPLPVISAALYTRYASRGKNGMNYRAVSGMRRVFGNHSGDDRS